MSNDLRNKIEKAIIRCCENSETGQITPADAAEYVIRALTETEEPHWLFREVVLSLENSGFENFRNNLTDRNSHD